MLNVVLIACGVVLLLLVFIVIYSNHKATENRWLGAFLISGFIWLLANFLAYNSTTNLANLRFSRFTTVGAALVAYSFLMFCYSFIHKKLSPKTIIGISAPIALLLMIAPTNLSIKSVSENIINPGLAYYALLILIIFYFSLGTKLLLDYYKISQQIVRQQLYFILIGVILTVIPGIILNGILPLIGITKAANYGPMVVIFFSVFTSVAIVKHRLLDIRLIVTRSVAYLLSLLTIGGIFVVIAYTLFTSILRNLSISSLTWVYSFAVVVLAVLFPLLKRFFDKLTKKLFFRDDYDTQDFLNKFNNILVSNFALNPLLKKTANAIKENIKPSYCLFGIHENGRMPPYILGTEGHPIFNDKDINFVRKITPKMHRKIIVAELLEEKYSDLKEILLKNDISILARLSTSIDMDGIGYLVLGPKRSGNMYSSQDIKVLEIVANELVVAIQNAMHTEEIEQFNLTLQERIKDATYRLRKTNEKLRALDEAKDDFVSMASHQLRTPLTSVKGNISLVLEGDAGKISNVQNQLLSQAFASSQRMVYLIADLLNVSRLNTGKFVIERTPVNLANLVEEEVSQLSDSANSHHLTLIYKKPEHITSLMLDDTKTRQVIMNFVDNAIYYTPSGGRVEVLLTETLSAVECRVIDTGIGVPKEEAHHLFTKFYRAGNARKARPDGTGLGLFMAKKVIMAEGGAIIFTTEEGKGSTFGFSFPKASLAIESAPKLPTRRKVSTTSKSSV